MFTAKFFELLLNLGDTWSVIGVEADHVSDDICIRVQYTKEIAECPDTKEKCRIYDHAPERRWRHLDTMQYKTYIICELPRIKNSKKETKTIIPPWASKHERHTYLFEHAAIDLLKATKNQTKTAQILRCKFNVINRILHISTERGLERRETSKLPIDHLSIDEKSFHNGHKYITVLSSPTNGKVIDVVMDRTKDAVNQLINDSLTPEQQGKVKTISMDMWRAYMTVSKERFPQARIVHDRFHLIKYLSDAIDKVRRREVKKYDLLKNARFAILKNECNMTEEQRIKFEAIKLANYQTSKAWEVRENFRAMFNMEQNITKAFIILNRWLRDTKDKAIAEVTKVAMMFERHMEGVANALISRFSNAMAERLNGKIQEIKMAGRGYRRFENFRSAILFFHAGLDLYPLK